jgi:hypothetical protein
MDCSCSCTEGLDPEDDEDEFACEDCREGNHHPPEDGLGTGVVVGMVRDVLDDGGLFQW